MIDKPREGTKDYPKFSVCFLVVQVVSGSLQALHCHEKWASYSRLTR